MPYKDLEERKKYGKQYYKDHHKKAKEYDKKYRKNNPEKRRFARIKATYGLSHQDWLKMWEEQDGRCIICGMAFATPTNAQVDHDHNTGEIRGLLCNHCNFAIGLFNDNPEFMIRAIKYLRKNILKK